ncbi:MAG: ArsA-related P-loop ATPase [Polyangiaceae bacterium]
MSLRQLLAERSLLICVGSGGVGKTSLAAALGLSAARSGRRGAVLTIDPARALGRALGIESFEGELRPLDAKLLTEADLPADLPLQIGMLRPAHAWDEFVRRHATTPELAESIVNNPFYRQLSRTFAGATEYAALEELCRLRESGSYDLIVLDTPPAAHALDFVRARRRLEALLRPEVAGVLFNPRSVAGQLVRRLQRATGKETLQSVAALGAAFGQLLGALQDRSQQISTLLAARGTAFVIVTGPEPEALQGASALNRELDELQLPLGAVIQNRVHSLPERADEAAVAEAIARLRAAGGSSDVCGWLSETCRDALALARSESARWERFQSGLSREVARSRVQELEHDVRSVGDVMELAKRLVSS